MISLRATESQSSNGLVSDLGHDIMLLDCWNARQPIQDYDKLTKNKRWQPSTCQSQQEKTHCIVDILSFTDCYRTWCNYSDRAIRTAKTYKLEAHRDLLKGV